MHETFRKLNTALVIARL